MKLRPTPLEFFAGLGFATFLCGSLAQSEGAVIPWTGILWVSLIVAAIAGAVGLWWDRMEDRERGR